MTTAKLAVPMGAKWHVAVLDSSVTACGLDCSFVPISTARAARSIDGDDRCQSPGCRSRWPAQLRLVS